MSQIEFFTPVSIGDREWGTETLVALSSLKYSGKVITMKAGHKGGLQYHREKDEADYVISGNLIIRWVEDQKIQETTVTAGESVRFPPGLVHQVEAITDSVLFEISTPHFNDRVNVEDLFCLPENQGSLPTTKPEDIEVW